MKKGIPSTRKHRPAQKYLAVGHTIRSRIEAGEYALGQRMPTETELARDLKVNPLTVSRALRELVREGRIYRRRGDGTYVSDGRHQPLIPGRHLRLGILWMRSVLPARMQGTFAGELTCGALDAWRLEGQEARWPSAGEPEPTRAVWSQPARGVTVEVLGESLASDEMHPPIGAVRAAGFDGILCMGITQTSFIEQLLELGAPVVLVDFPNDRFAGRADQVFADPGPAYRAVARSWSTEGLTRIHFAGSLQRCPQGEPTEQIWNGHPLRLDPDTHLRMSAWRQGLSEAGIQARDAWTHAFWYEDRFNAEALETVLALPESERPQAVLCHGQGHADLLVKAFTQCGWPLRAVGASSQPSVSDGDTIRVDARGMGALAAQLLHWRLSQPGRPNLRAGVAMTWRPAATVHARP